MSIYISLQIDPKDECSNCVDSRVDIGEEKKAVWPFGRLCETGAPAAGLQACSKWRDKRNHHTTVLKHTHTHTQKTDESLRCAFTS